MENLHMKNPLYPLICLISSVFIFFIGLLVAKNMTIIYLLLALSSLYILFGYGKVLMKVLPMFLLIGCITGFGAILTSGKYVTGIQTLGRILILAYAAVPMISLPPIHLTRNLEALKFPRILTLGMLTTIRFGPILLGETKQIREAMKTRGVNVSWYNVKVLYRAFLIPFLMRIISMSDIMAVSIETRGFTMGPAQGSVYREVKLVKRDLIFALALSFILIGALILWIR